MDSKSCQLELLLKYSRNEMKNAYHFKIFNYSLKESLNEDENNILFAAYTRLIVRKLAWLRYVLFSDLRRP